MYLDYFDRRIVEVLKVEGRPMTLAGLVKATGFTRSTIIIHLERLVSEGLVLREKKPSGDVEEPNSYIALLKPEYLKIYLNPALPP